MSQVGSSSPTLPHPSYPSIFQAVCLVVLVTVMENWPIQMSVSVWHRETDQHKCLYLPGTEIIPVLRPEAPRVTTLRGQLG